MTAGTPPAAALPHESVQDCVVVPPDAAAALRRRLGLAPSQVPRIVYVAGPGDVLGTFGHWLRGAFDPRVPVIAYSTQLYTLVGKLAATALVLHEHPGPPDPAHAPATGSATVAAADAATGGTFRFVHVARRSAGGRLRYLMGNIGFSLRAWRLIRAWDPHLVLFATDCPQLLPLLLPRRVRLVLAAHNTYWPAGRRPGRLRDRIRLGLTARLLRRVGGAICTSAECARQIAALRGSAAGVVVETPQMPLRRRPPALRDAPPDINPDIDPDINPPDGNPDGDDRRGDDRHGSDRHGNDPGGDVRLIYLGRIEADKGVFDLLAAFEAVAAAHPLARLDFAGSGSVAGDLAARIAASPHAGRIRYLGRLSAAGVHDVLAGSDLLICPTRSSFNEGLALVVVEAAVHGVPSLVSSVVPAQDLFAGACVVFAADDTAALQARLAELIADPAQRDALRRAVRADVGRFFDRGRSWGSELCRALLA